MGTHIIKKDIIQNEKSIFPICLNSSNTENTSRASFFSHKANFDVTNKIF